MRRAAVHEIAAGAFAVVSVELQVKVFMPPIVADPEISFLRRCVAGMAGVVQPISGPGSGAPLNKAEPQAFVALFAMYYNFVRIHKTLRLRRPCRECDQAALGNR